MNTIKMNCEISRKSRESSNFSGKRRNFIIVEMTNHTGIINGVKSKEGKKWLKKEYGSLFTIMRDLGMF